jgi:hypothetical protein
MNLSLEAAQAVQRDLVALGFTVSVHASPEHSQPTGRGGQPIPALHASVHVRTRQWTSVDLERFSTWLNGVPELDMMVGTDEFVVTPGLPAVA